MKKKYVILIIIIILVSIISYIAVNKIIKNNRKYEIAKIENYNYFLLKQNNLYGIIDKQGNIVIDASFDNITIPNPEKAVFVCYLGDEIKVYNDKKQEIFTNYEQVEAIRLNNVATDVMYEKTVLKYKEQDKFGLIDLEGNIIKKAIYEEINAFEYKEGELLVKQNGKYGLINIKGATLIDIKYDEISLDQYYTEQNKYNEAGYIVGNKTEEGYRYGYINSERTTNIKYYI